MDSAGPPKVALLFPGQHAEAAAMLGRAFVNDPLINAIVGGVTDADARAKRMAHLFSVILTEQGHSGQPVLGVVHDRQVGAAAIIEQVERPSSSASTVIRGLTLLPELVR